MPVYEAASLTPLGGRGHHGALAQQAGTELPEVRSNRAAKSHTKPSFPLPLGSRALSSGSAQLVSGCVLLCPGQAMAQDKCFQGCAVSQDKPCPGMSCVLGASGTSSCGCMCPHSHAHPQWDMAKHEASTLRGKELVHGQVRQGVQGGMARLPSRLNPAEGQGMEERGGVGVVAGGEAIMERGCRRWFVVWDRGMSVLAEEAASRGNALPMSAPVKRGWFASAGTTMLMEAPPCCACAWAPQHRGLQVGGG